MSFLVLQARLKGLAVEEEFGAEVPFSRTWKDGDDLFSLVLRSPGDFKGCGNGGPGGNAAKDSLDFGQVPGDLKGLIIGHGDDLVNDGCIEDLRDESGADSLDFMGTRVPS